MADPDPRYDDVVAEVGGFLAERAGRGPRRRHPARADRASTPASTSARRPGSRCSCCADRRPWPASAIPLLLSASNKTFLGVLLDLDIDRRRTASLSAAALGVTLGCRVLRVHDVAGTCRVRDALAAVAGAW